jgi:hypothetical protein
VPAAEKIGIEAVRVYNGNPAKPYRSVRDRNLDLLRAWLNHPDTCIPVSKGLGADNRDMLFEEASSLAITGTNPVSFMSKLKHSKVLGRSPDRLDATALTMHDQELRTHETDRIITPAEYMKRIYAT